MRNVLIAAETASTDEELCRLCMQGDSAAGESLVRRYSRLVRCCCRPLFLMGGDQEDLIQEGMLGLTLAIRRYDESRNASFRTYAERCIRTRLYTAIRDASSTTHAPLNEAVPLEPDGPVWMSYQDDPETLAVDRDAFQERLRQYQQQLTPLEEQVLTLYLQGLSYQEIAQRLDRSVKSVDNAVQRIRRKLQSPR
ncbi:MAG: sigma-70 family RNA polymerase sigma factor [Clostridiales bacterium]|nr:sigma-70 family RNA polymerase sigma factor [Clostridiales bacterium]